MNFSAMLAPASFVVLWSTGFIGAKLGLPSAESATFLSLRYGLAALAMGAIALASAAPWSLRPGELLHLAIAGLLLHFLYIGGVFVSIERGLPAGASALIVSLQPLLTAIAAGPLLGERLVARQWCGFVLGLLGVGLTISENLRLGSGDLAAVLAAGVALLGITAGTLYQKRFLQHMDLRSGTALQYVAATAAFLVCAAAFESLQVRWHWQFVLAVGWLATVLSVGAVTLLFVLLRRGAAARVSALFYLVPPCTALFAWLLFDERFGALAACGLALSVAGVALATRPTGAVR